jgi:MarR family transcriptional regulator, lower aerobic nicotinate degradation pathway regulator
MVHYQQMSDGTLVAMARAGSTQVERIPYGLLLARLGQESVARFRRAVRPLNLGAQEFIVLKQLQAIGSCSQGALADALGIDYSNLAGVTGELYRRGLIARTRDEADRRRYVVELSEEGLQLLADADKAIVAGEEEMLAVLGEEEREQLWDLLRRMADSLELCPTEAEACAEVATDQDLAESPSRSQ